MYFFEAHFHRENKIHFIRPRSWAIVIHWIKVKKKKEKFFGDGDNTLLRCPKATVGFHYQRFKLSEHPMRLPVAQQLPRCHLRMGPAVGEQSLKQG